MIEEVALQFDGINLSGGDLVKTVRTVADLKGLFKDEVAYQALDPKKVVYEVSSFYPVSEGTAGGLFWGMTYLHPGTVGDEYHMTKGHFHTEPSCAEYYHCNAGTGVLLLMDKNRNTRAEMMKPGSLHYIHGTDAHRVVNTGAETLIFAACWPANAGHDYDSIQKDGFSKRVIQSNGAPALV